MSAPPPRLTPEQRAAYAALVGAGVPAGLALDGARGRIRADDLLRWNEAYRAATAAARAKWGWHRPG